MTIPTERYRAVLQTRLFLADLCDPASTPRVPRSVRQWALRCLRHYPGALDMQETAKACPDVWGRA